MDWKWKWMKSDQWRTVLATNLALTEAEGRKEKTSMSCHVTRKRSLVQSAF